MSFPLSSATITLSGAAVSLTSVFDSAYFSPTESIWVTAPSAPSCLPSTFVVFISEVASASSDIPSSNLSVAVVSASFPSFFSLSVNSSSTVSTVWPTAWLVSLSVTSDFGDVASSCPFSAPASVTLLSIAGGASCCSWTLSPSAEALADPRSLVFLLFRRAKKPPKIPEVFFFLGDGWEFASSSEGSVWARLTASLSESWFSTSSSFGPSTFSLPFSDGALSIDTGSSLASCVSTGTSFAASAAAWEVSSISSRLSASAVGFPSTFPVSSSSPVAALLSVSCLVSAPLESPTSVDSLSSLSCLVSRPSLLPSTSALTKASVAGFISAPSLVPFTSRCTLATSPRGSDASLTPVSSLVSGAAGLVSGVSLISVSLLLGLASAFFSWCSLSWSLPLELAPRGLSGPPLDFLRRPNRVSMTDLFFGVVCGLPSLVFRGPFGELKIKQRNAPSNISEILTESMSTNIPFEITALLDN